MEKFVLRGVAAAALAASLADAAPSPLQKKRQRQTTIHHGDKVVSEERVQYLKEELDDAKTTNMLSILEDLEHIFVSLEMMEKTRIGVTLTRLYRRTDDLEVQYRAKKLLKLWKARAKKAMRRRARRVETYGRNYAD